MAKARSGLGRGLGSLLGEMPVSLEAEENAAEPEVQNEEPQEGKKEESPKSAEMPAPPEPPKPVEEELYSNKEDNVTIKSVVERIVDTPAPPTTLLSTPPANRHVGQAEKRSDMEVDIELIQPNPDQPRINFKKEDLEELANSIEKNGLLQPILVRKVDDAYQIIAGERRWQACKKLGMKKIPVRIKDAGDDEAVILALVENVQRSDLNPIEEAYGYRRMMERGKMTQSEVAQAVSKGRSTIANALRLLELPEDAQQLLFEEKITAGHARAILSVPTTEGRQKLTEKLIEENLSVREAENLARLYSGVKKEAKPRAPQPKSYKTVARALKDTLATDVKIKSTGGKNKIEIQFKDEADLERLFRLITSE